MEPEIHPPPAIFAPTEIAARPILQFFHYEHLPPRLKAVSQPFCELAARIHHTLPVNAESTTALRKLLEAKDCAVRAVVGA